MSEGFDNLLLRNLKEVFGETDAARRRRSIAELWTQDGIFVDPGGVHVGATALDAAIAGLHARFPGLRLHPVGRPQAFHGVGRLAWSHGPAGGAPALSGEDVATFRDGRIAALYAFLDDDRA